MGSPCMHKFQIVMYSEGELRNGGGLMAELGLKNQRGGMIRMSQIRWDVKRFGREKNYSI